MEAALILYDIIIHTFTGSPLATYTVADLLEKSMNLLQRVTGD